MTPILISRAPAFRARHLAALALVLAAACRDSTSAPAGPPPDPIAVAAAFRCRASVEASPSVSCAHGVPAAARSTDAAVQAALQRAPREAPTLGPNSFPTADILIGGRRYLALSPRITGFNAGTRTMSVAVDFDNRLGQPMGTLDGVTPDGVDGVRLVLVQDPVAVGTGSGAVVADARWSQTVVTQQGSRPAVRCSGDELADIVQPDEIGICDQAGFVLDPAVRQFEFVVVVSARLPDESPLGFANEPNLAADVGVLGTGGCAAKPLGFVTCWGSNEFGQQGRVSTGFAYGAAATPGFRSGVGLYRESQPAIAAGATHGCALRIDGVAECWGSNAYSEAGLVGYLIGRAFPTAIDNATTRFTAIAAGRQFTCGVTETQQVRCWGRNDALQLGSAGAATGLSRAIGASLLATRVATGRAHACALEVGTGAVWCWGDNSRGQLGRGATGAAALPAVVPALGAAATDVAVGDDHTCALLVTGRLECWGANESGQVGNDNADADVLTPTLVGPSGLAEVAAGGRNTCAFTTGGTTTYCWGDNREGQLGAASLASYEATPAVVSLPAALALAVGDAHVCAVVAAAGDNVRCWGSDFTRGLGTNVGAVIGRRTNIPVAASGTGALSTIAAGDGFTCGVSSEVPGTLTCWGANGVGQSAAPPVPEVGVSAGILGRARLQRVWGGTMHACGLDVDGRAWCWGNNAFGQLGRGTSGDLGASAQAAPDTVNGPALRFAELALGRAHTCGRTLTNEIWCWGDNGRSQVTDAVVTLLSPAGRAALGTGIQLAAGAYHTCFVGSTTPRTTICFGDNGWGQGGNGSRTTSADRRAVLPWAVANSVILAAGDRHTCAFTTDQFATTSIDCWGVNTRGQLGGSGQIPGVVATTPTLAFPITFQNGVVRGIMAGRDHTCLTADPYEGISGGVQCWGDDFDSQLGRGTSGGFSNALDVVRRTGFAPPADRLEATVARSSPGATHSCAISRGSVVLCWGGTGLRGESGNGGFFAPRAIEVLLP